MATEPKRYGRWSGNPRGMIENLANCIETVWGREAWDHGKQCSRKRGYGTDGLRCKQHADRRASAVSVAL